jgi:CRP-like cAMP-binding protein
MTNATGSNAFLEALPKEHLKDLRPHLASFELVPGAVLADVGDVIEHAYFPLSGVISVTVPLKTGDVIEAAMVGNDGVAGGSAAFGVDRSIHRLLVQAEGSASAIKVGALRAIVRNSPDVANLLIRYEQLILVQAQQTAACNASHRLEARIARWLLRYRDLVASKELHITQDFMADMLGVRRTSVSLAANKLKASRLIDYRRGRIHILDASAVEGQACECYEEFNRQYDRLFNLDLSDAQRVGTRAINPASSE